MIEQTYLDGGNFIYVKIRAVIWTMNGLKTASNIELDTGKLIERILKETPCEKTLVLDFNGIINEIDHSLKPFFDSISQLERLIVFVNFDDIYVILLKYVKGIGIKNTTINNNFWLINTDIYNEDDINEIKLNIEKVCTVFLRKTISESFIEFENKPRTLPSTPITATGVFDSSVIVSNPKKFLWICIFLSEKVEEIKKQILNPVKLLTVSNKVAPFALAIGLITDTQVDLIDFDSPESRVYNLDDLEYLKLHETKKNYIYIGDFVFGGTEIKIAKTYITAFNKNLEFAIALGSLFNPDIFKESFKLISLTSLDGLNNKAKYSLNLSSK